MSEYKRLTARYMDEFGNKCVKKLDWDGAILHRLAELEDKIEQGTLIELPCEVGDTVYCLISQGRFGTIYTTGIPVERKINGVIFDGKRFEIYSERVYPDYYNNNGTFYGYWGETVFSTKAEAEAKLKEFDKYRGE